MVNNKLTAIKKSSDYLEISKLGKRIHLSKWLVLQILDSDDQKSYYGITVSKKVGNAVIRNKLKRWIKNFSKTENWPEELCFKKTVFVFRSQNDGFYKKLEYFELKELFKKTKKLIK